MEENASEGYCNYLHRMTRYFGSKEFSGQTDQEVLELLLTYTIPYCDVRPLARELMEHFGSLSSLFEAAIEELLEVEGISEPTAVLIAMMPTLTRFYSMDKWKAKPKIETAVKAKEYAHVLFIGEEYEVFYLICLDAQCQVIRACRLCQGTIDQAAVYTRNVVELALRYKACNVMLAHNHPSGKAQPSADDIATTKVIYEALRPLNIKLLDHIIIGGEEAYCFSNQGMKNSLYGTESKQRVAENHG